MIVIAVSVLLTSQERSPYQAPDKLKLFSFMKSLPQPRTITYCPTVSYKSDRGYASFPGWQYMIDTSALNVAHLLKRALTKREGWELTFPDMHYYWRCNAVHAKNGKQDWQLRLIGFDKGGAVLDIWDESRAVSIKRPDWFPLNSIGPLKKAKSITQKHPR